MRVTLKDIAQEAGVSVSMVSYVLNKSGRLTKEKHKQIMEIANKYNYVPDANAKSLVTGVTNNVGFMINKDREALFQQPFIMQCIGELSGCLREYSGWLSLCMAQDMDAGELRHYLANANFDGIVFMFATQQQEKVKLLRDRKIPCVFLDSGIVEDDLANIYCNDELGISMEVDHLAAMGHKKILFLAAKDTHPLSGDLRRSAYEQAVRSHGLSYEKAVYTGYERRDIYKALDQLIGGGEWPTAMVAASDKIAWGAIDYLREHGIRVPEDISVTGFDDVDMGRNEEYGLTTVRQPVHEMIVDCVNYIYECQESGELKPYYRKWDPSLIVRSSTGKVSDIAQA